MLKYMLTILEIGMLAGGAGAIAEGGLIKSRSGEAGELVVTGVCLVAALGTSFWAWLTSPAAGRASRVLAMICAAPGCFCAWLPGIASFVNLISGRPRIGSPFGFASIMKKDFSYFFLPYVIVVILTILPIVVVASVGTNGSGQKTRASQFRLRELIAFISCTAFFLCGLSCIGAL